MWSHLRGTPPAGGGSARSGGLPAMGFLLVPIGMVALVGAVAGAALFIRHRREHEPVEENEV